MFVTCAGVGTESVDILKITRSRDTEKAVSWFASSGEPEIMHILELKDGLSEDDVVWLMNALSDGKIRKSLS